MQLSDHQVRIVNAFLRDAALETPAEPPSARMRVLTQIRRQLRDEFSRRNDSPLGDEELIRLLNRIQFPDRAAQADAGPGPRVAPPTHFPAGANGSNVHAYHANGPANVATLPPANGRPLVESPLEKTTDAAPVVRVSRQPLPSGPLASSQRIWLGACIALAEKLNAQVTHVRAAFFAVGVLTGPVAVAIYLALYASFYLGEHGPGAPRVNRRDLVRGIGEAVVVFAAMGLAFAMGLLTVDFVHKLAIGYPPADTKWSSMAGSVDSVLGLSATIVLPFAVLRGLPAAPPWDLLLPRLLRAAFIGIAALLALAFASYLTGALMSGISDWPA